MTDLMSSVGGLRTLTGQLASLGPALSSAASSGDFGAVLAQINSDVQAVSGGGPIQSPSTLTLAGASGGAATGSSTTGAGQLGAASYAASYAASDTAGGGAGQAVVADAEKYLGVPYQWGGTDPSSGLDCSGLVQRVYSDLGVQLPRTSEEQVNVGTPVADLSQAQPGDLVFFGGNGYDGSPSSPGHVGIYVGNGMMIDAPHTGTSVQVQPVGTPVAIRRILPSGSIGGLSGSYPAANLLSTTTGSSGESAAMASLGVPASLQPLFESAGSRYGVNPLLLASVAKQESGFQPGAVSGAGAQGLMQLMPATAAGLGVSALDPAQSIDGAAQLLSGYLQNYGGSVPLALAAYNAGPGAVAQYGGVPPYTETQNYVSNITSMLASASAVAL